MYRRLDEEKIEELMGLYVEDRLYQMLAPALQELSERYDDLTPVEVWDEAMGVIETLKKAKIRKDVCVRQVRANLLNRYKDFAWEDGRTERRDSEGYTRSTDLVLMVVVSMLRSTKKVREDNPHLKTINILLEMLRESTIIDYFLDRSERTEKSDEDEYGELPEKDYMIGDKEEIKAMLLQGKEFAVEGFKDSYEVFVDELLEDKRVRESLMGAKSLNENFHAKAVYWILGLMMSSGVIEVTASKLARKLGRSNGNKYLSPQNIGFSPDIQTYIKNLCEQYKKGAE